MINPTKLIKPVLIGIGILFATIVLYQNSSLFKYFFKNLFVSNKTYLEKTVLAIKEVNSISEWITAEYYGEVMFSWKEYQELPKDTSQTRFVPFESIKSLEQMYVWKDTARKVYLNLHLELNNPQTKNRRKIKYRNYKKRDSLKKTTLFKDLKGILRSEDKNTFNFVRDHALYSDEFNQVISKRIRKRERNLLGNPKKDLVLLGRGWIKAGFNLDSLKKEQISTDLRNDTLFISGMPAPHIISSHINPWFIPKKLKGYEIVFIKKENKFTSEEVGKVKKGCLNKLEQNARETGLMQEAWESAEASVLTMLNLMGDDDIKVVVFNR